ncbi:Ankyrin repeat protein 1 [Giardia muris]|uniref:Ankyrin repeat protein 1 n=1 Tax=Giardia muris TaxID=5742 RepID=A0A4Z1SQL3_GIAMU|nr:Ankyrin repeat protein 1 [Giardia muris]|eukprot:TNJ28142.1 Ankyrin repeat protein 1 [Giardia muris]
MHASYRGFDECAELLLDEAGMQTARRKDGMAPGSTALMVAARFSRPECVGLLRDREKGVVDSEGHDALWYAENKGVNPNVKTSEVYRDPRVLRLLGKRSDASSRAEKGSSLTSTRANIHQPIPTSQHSIGAGNRSPCSLTESDGMQRTTLSPSAPLVAANLATASPSKKLDGTQYILSAEKSRLEKTISNLQRELQRMQEELANRNKEIQGLRAVNRQRSTNSIDGDVLTSQRIVSLAIPDSRTRMLQETLNQKNQKIDQLNAEIIGLRGDVKDREEEIRDLQAQLEKSLNLQAQLEASQNTRKKKQRELDDYIAALRLENEELRREYNRMETKNVREAEASRKENRQLEVLNNELARLRKEGEDRENHYRAAIEELKRKHNVEVTALCQRMEERDNMVDERSQREKEFKNTALALERAMAEIASLRKENEELHRTSSVVTSGPREQPLENKNREVPTSTSVSGQPRTRGDQVAQYQASTGREELVEMVKTGMDREREGGQARTAISHQSRLSPIDLLSRDAQTRADNYRQRELTSQRPAAEYQRRQSAATSGSTVAQLMAELGYNKREEYSPNTTAGVARDLSEQTRRGEGVHQRTSPYLTEHKETSIGSRVSGRSPDLPSRTYQYGPSRDVQAQPQKVMVNSRQSVQPSPRVTTSSRTNTSRSPKTPESDKKEDVRRRYDTSYGRLDSSTGRSVTRDASALVGRGTLASSPYSPKMSGNASTGATARAFKTVSPVTYSSSSGVSTGARAESHIPPSSRKPLLTGTRTNITTSSSYGTNARSPQITGHSRLTPTGIGAYSSGLNYRR